MRAWRARYIVVSFFLVGLFGIPAAAEIQSVSFKTTNKAVGFL